MLKPSGKNGDKNIQFSGGEGASVSLKCAFGVGVFGRTMSRADSRPIGARLDQIRQNPGFAAAAKKSTPPACPNRRGENTMSNQKPNVALENVPNVRNLLRYLPSCDSAIA